MSTIKSALRRRIQRVGYDIKRYPQSDPMWGLTQFLISRGIEMVLDVGANTGGFGQSLRQHGYARRLLSFEPSPWSYGRLQTLTSTDPTWTSLPLALGENEGEVLLNIAGNDEASSSILPMLERHRNAAPDSAYVSTVAVQQRRLDDVLGDEVKLTEGAPIHLKIDVQGYEMHVLNGASDLLSSPDLVSLQLELSLVNLYEGGMLWSDGLEFARQLGMRPVKFMPGFADPVSGEGLQFDGVFVRDSSSGVTGSP